ncbi:MAG: hypothetical protein KatS3mg090_0308 [Patescibacteria group bacterium]|nr:MAG: hypothetical protein KatS3mg090_0308 [Patescibacteria group bacterium]
MKAESYKVFLLSLIIVFSVVFTLTFYKFTEIPKNLDLDEVEFARLALDLENKPFTPYHEYATGHTTFYYYLILLSFKLFTPTNFSLRLVSAVFGLLSGLALVVLAKTISKDKVFILFFPIIVITQRWFFNFARFGFEATFLLFWEILAVLFLFRFLHRSDYKDLIAVSIFSGLAYNSYAAGRVFFLVPVVTILILSRKNRFKNLCIFTTVFALVTLPLNLYFLTKTLDIRAKQQIFLFDQNIKLNEKLLFIIENLKKYLEMFLTKGDVNGRHNYPLKPAINLIIALFFILGLSKSVKNIILKKFNKAEFVFLTWFAVTLSLSLITYPWENPNMLRTYFLLPALGYFSYEGINLTVAKLNLFKYRIIIFTLLITASLIYDARTYFLYQREVFYHSFKVIDTLDKLYLTDGLKLLNNEEILEFKKRYNY